MEFFVPSHGKGEHDGARAVIKRTLTHEELKLDGWPLKCAADVVSFLNATFQPRDQSHKCNTQKVFWLIGADDVQRELDQVKDELYSCSALIQSFRH